MPLLDLLQDASKCSVSLSGKPLTLFFWPSSLLYPIQELTSSFEVSEEELPTYKDLRHLWTPEMLGMSRAKLLSNA